jgi:peptidoglycan-associated lipoprotein
MFKWLMIGILMAGNAPVYADPYEFLGLDDGLECISLASEGTAIITTLPERWEFDFDSAQLPLVGGGCVERDLHRIVDSERHRVSIFIVGHADAPGRNGYNKELGRARASALRDALINLGIQEKRITIASMGELEPIIYTPGPERRNRRLEIEISLSE